MYTSAFIPIAVAGPGPAGGLVGMPKSINHFLQNNFNTMTQNSNINNIANSTVPSLHPTLSLIHISLSNSPLTASGLLVFSSSPPNTPTLHDENENDKMIYSSDFPSSLPPELLFFFGHFDSLPLTSHWGWKTQRTPITPMPIEIHSNRAMIFLNKIKFILDGKFHSLSLVNTNSPILYRGNHSISSLSSPMILLDFIMKTDDSQTVSNHKINEENADSLFPFTVNHITEIANQREENTNSTSISISHHDNSVPKPFRQCFISMKISANQRDKDKERLFSCSILVFEMLSTAVLPLQYHLSFPFPLRFSFQRQFQFVSFPPHADIDVLLSSPFTPISQFSDEEISAMKSEEKNFEENIRKLRMGEEQKNTPQTKTKEKEKEEEMKMSKQFDKDKDSGELGENGNAQMQTKAAVSSASSSSSSSPSLSLSLPSFPISSSPSLSLSSLSSSSSPSMSSLSLAVDLSGHWLLDRHRSNPFERVFHIMKNSLESNGKINGNEREKERENPNFNFCFPSDSDSPSQFPFPSYEKYKSFVTIMDSLDISHLLHYQHDVKGEILQTIETFTINKQKHKQDKDSAHDDDTDDVHGEDASSSLPLIFSSPPVTFLLDGIERSSVVSSITNGILHVRVRIPSSNDEIHEWKSLVNKKKTLQIHTKIIQRGKGKIVAEQFRFYNKKEREKEKEKGVNKENVTEKEGEIHEEEEEGKTSGDSQRKVSEKVDDYEYEDVDHNDNNDNDNDIDDEEEEEERAHAEILYSSLSFPSRVHGNVSASGPTHSSLSLNLSGVWVVSKSLSQDISKLLKSMNVSLLNRASASSLTDTILTIQQNKENITVIEKSTLHTLSVTYNNFSHPVPIEYFGKSGTSTIHVDSQLGRVTTTNKFLRDKRNTREKFNQFTKDIKDSLTLNNSKGIQNQNQSESESPIARANAIHTTHQTNTNVSINAASMSNDSSSVLTGSSNTSTSVPLHITSSLSDSTAVKAGGEGRETSTSLSDDLHNYSYSSSPSFVTGILTIIRCLVDRVTLREEMIYSENDVILCVVNRVLSKKESDSEKRVAETEEVSILFERKKLQLDIEKWNEIRRKKREEKRKLKQNSKGKGNEKGKERGKEKEKEKGMEYKEKTILMEKEQKKENQNDIGDSDSRVNSYSDSHFPSHSLSIERNGDGAQAKCRVGEGYPYEDSDSHSRSHSYSQSRGGGMYVPINAPLPIPFFMSLGSHWISILFFILSLIGSNFSQKHKVFETVGLGIICAFIGIVGKMRGRRMKSHG